MPSVPLPDPGIADLFLKTFMNVFTFAWAGMTPQVLWLVSRTAVWCLIPACIVAMLGLQFAISPIVSAVMKVSMIAWCVANLHMLSNTLIDWVVTIGLMPARAPAFLVGYTPMTLAEFMSPGTVLWKGFDMMLPVLRYVEQLSWYKVGTILMYDMLCVIPLWICFVIVTISIIVAVVEFAIIAWWFLIPLALSLFTGTAYIAAQGLSGVISSALRLGMLAMVTGLILPLTFYLAIPSPDGNVTIWNVLSAGFGAVFLGLMAWFAPRYASSFFGGQAAFTGQALIGFAVGGAIGLSRGIGRALR